MSELAEKLIAENLKTKNPMLDLGNCNLDGSEKELYEPLAKTRHLQVLILSDNYWVLDAQKEMVLKKESQNKGKRNQFIQIPEHLPKTLKKISINGTSRVPAQVQEYSSLLELKNLEHLEVDYQENLDLEVIGQLSQLQVLTCYAQGELEEAHHLSNLKQLVFLDIRDHEIELIEFLDDLTQLKHFWGNINDRKEVKSIAQLKQLRSLILDNGVEQLSNLFFIAELRDLIKLSIQYNTIEEVDSLKELKNLKYLDLTFNSLGDLQGLENLTTLEELKLADNRIESEDLEVLKDLKRLKKLDLSNNQIYKLNALENLTQLEELHLNGNPLKDTNSVIKLENLKSLEIDLDAFSYPPIWYMYLKSKGGKMGNYLQLSELPQVEKIWQLLKTKEEENINLAQQLAKGQGWTEEEFEMYRNLL